MTTTRRYRDAAMASSTGEVFGFLLVLEHEDLVDGPVRLTDILGEYDPVQDTYLLTVGDDEYIFAPMEIEPPEMTDDEPVGRIAIPDIDERIGEAIDGLTGPPTVTLTAVLRSAPNEIVGGPFHDMLLQGLAGKAGDTIEGELRFPSLVDEPYPQDTLRSSKYVAAARMTER